MRLVVIDGFRGIFLLFMMIAHGDVIVDTVAGKLNHHRFGWVEDAQGFVFMSGLVVGLVYGGRYLRGGYDTMRMAVWARIRTIYSHQIALILLFLTVALVTLNAGITPPAVLAPYAAEPVLFPLLSAILVTGSLHMGILPMYIVFLMLTPLAIVLIARRHYMLYGAIMVALWAIAQTQLLDHATVALERGLADAGHRVRLGIYFNPLGWQVLFFAGLVIGVLTASKRLDLSIARTPEARTVFLVCVAMFVLYGIYDRIVFDDLLGRAFSAQVLAQVDRGNFSLIYLLAFAVNLFGFFWLLTSGRTDANPVLRAVANLTHRIVTLPPLVFLGQHSLHVFSAHIVLVYVLTWVYQDGPPGELEGTLVLAGSLAMLFAVAWLHAQMTARDARKARMKAKAEG